MGSTTLVQTLATTTGTLATSISHISIDWFIFAALIVLLTIDALRSGSGRTAAIALALPAAGLFFEGLSKTAVIGQLVATAASPLAQAILFIALVVGLYFVINRMMPHYDDISGSPLLGVLSGLATAVAIMATWVHLPFLAAIWHFGGPTVHLFDDPFRLWWLLASFLALAFVRG
jgi:hypothetical protein